MVTIKDVFYPGATAGQQVTGGIRIFGYFHQCAEGVIERLTDDELTMSGTYHIDETIDGYHICGEGSFHASLLRFSDEHWEAKGLYDGHDTIRMSYRYEDDYHVLDGTASHFRILSQTWSDYDSGVPMFHVYASIVPETVVLPSFYISLKP